MPHIIPLTLPTSIIYDSHEELESALIGYPKVIAHVLQGEGFFIKKLENGELDIVKRLRTSDFRVGSPKPDSMRA